MIVTRRQFATRAFAALTLAAAFPFLAGCPGVTQSQVAQLIAEVGTALAEIMPYLKTVSAATAQKIEDSFLALETAVQNWKPGTTIAVIEQVVNDFVANMNLIPVLADYQPLVALIVATVEGLVSLLVPTALPSSVTSSARQMAAVKGAPKNAKQFRKAWNEAVRSRSGIVIS